MAAGRARLDELPEQPDRGDGAARALRAARGARARARFRVRFGRGLQRGLLRRAARVGAASRRSPERRGREQPLEALVDDRLPIGLRGRRPGARRGPQGVPPERRHGAAGVRPARVDRRLERRGARRADAGALSTQARHPPPRARALRAAVGRRRRDVLPLGRDAGRRVLGDVRGAAAGGRDRLCARLLLRAGRRGLRAPGARPDRGGLRAGGGAPCETIRGVSSTFDERVAAITARDDYVQPAAWALGVATRAADGSTLDTWFPRVNCGSHCRSGATIWEAAGAHAAPAVARVDAGSASAALEVSALQEDPADRAAHPNSHALESLARFADGVALGGARRRELVAVFLPDLAAAPVSVEDAYLRLHLLSPRAVQPHGLSLEGVFGFLPNVVWTTDGPYPVEGFEEARMEALAEGVELRVRSVDKFPRMTDYVVPPGVRIADADRVRLGAHLAEGTTVMHEGFVNYNAGTLGHSMVEGRISAGVVVGDGTDVGGGASIMGTLSGGNAIVISVGERCLLGANSGLGIPLGDDCTVESGLYLTAGTKVRLPDGTVARARELSGISGMLFRRDSQSGAVEALPRSGAGWHGLNAALHAN